MELVKYRHACFTVEKDGQLLVVDPGGFSTDFIAPENVIGVIITHEHSDHFDHEQLAAIIDKNPDALIFAPEAVAHTIEVFTTKAMQPGDTYTLGMFTLAFFGGTHATIHATIPPIANLGVMINDLLYYPGDSFVLPHKSVDTLALPAAAPWMQIGDAMDFLAAVKPRFAFPTHDAILSTEGKEIHDRLLATTAKRYNIEYVRLENSITI